MESGYEYGEPGDGKITREATAPAGMKDESFSRKLMKVTEQGKDVL